MDPEAHLSSHLNYIHTPTEETNNQWIMPEIIPSSPFAFYAFYQLYRQFYDVPKLTVDIIHQRLYSSQDISDITGGKHSLFITWKKRVHSRGRHVQEIPDSDEADNYALRGCIGTFAKLPITLGIERYSLIAAFQDSRFPAIQATELKDLKCSCNVLSKFTTIYESGDGGDISDWEIGKHGIELVFKDPYHEGKLLSSTFLPDVMTEQGWDKTTTFYNLIEKAGVTDHLDDILHRYQDCFVKVIRYEGIKSEIDYDHFMQGLQRIT